MADATPVPIKGAGQCPVCACRKVRQVSAPSGFYADVLEVCVNCSAVWEPIDQALIWDPDDHLCAFSEPCGNCAFRPGSPEQGDTAKWTKLIDSLKAGGQFFCHKGVPIDPASEHGFKYPTQPRKLRLCRGYLNMMGPHWKRQFGEPDQDAPESAR